MAEPSNIAHMYDHTKLTRSQTVSTGGGGGGGDSVDTDTKNYVDAKMEATRAQNDARFAEVLAKFDTLSSKIDNLPKPMSVLAFAGMLVTAIVASFTMLGLMSDRFDGGIAASSLISNFQQAQAERDAKQDADFRDLLNILKQRPSQ